MHPLEVEFGLTKEELLDAINSDYVNNSRLRFPLTEIAPHVSYEQPARPVQMTLFEKGNVV